MSASETVVVVGAGQAAAQFAASLRGGGFGGQLIVVGEEPHIPYQRPPLSKHLLSGAVGVERAYVKPADFYPSSAIDLRLDSRVEGFDRAAKTVRLGDGGTLSYDKLVLATGSRVRALDVAGAAAGNVYYLRTLDDMRAIQQQFIDGRRLAVVGGGYIGLEVAAVAVGKGLQVTVLEQGERLMQRVVGPEISAFYHALHEGQGVTLRTAAEVKEFSGGDPARALVCADGSRVEADFFIVGVGILPNVELAEAAGLEVANGVVVDAHGATSDADVYAIGDCTNLYCERYDRRVRLESVPNALGQAKAAAAALAGAPRPYTEVPWFWSDQYKLKLQIVGFSDGYDEAVTRGDPATQTFMRCYLRDGELLAVESVNNPKEFMTCRKLVAERARLDPARLADVGVALADAAL